MELSETFCIICYMYTTHLFVHTVPHSSFHLTLIKLLLFLGTGLDGCRGGTLEGTAGAEMKILTWFFMMIYEYFKSQVSNPHSSV